MHHHPLRKETNCLNCGETVQDRFCSHCGQENLETRQPFHSLFFHFFEDLTHYEGKFWTTMRFLLFRSAFLTKEFLAGRRGKFVPPVRLYIFISFITFFLPSILPDDDSETLKTYSEAQTDTVVQATTDFITFHTGDQGLEVLIPRNYSTVAALDSIIAAMPAAERPGDFKYWFLKRMVSLQHKTPLELGENFLNQFKASFPKALFLFLPLFAMVLWLFHSRKFWLYYDHAVFTLHYFSFMLLFLTVVNVITAIFSFNLELSDGIAEVLNLITIVYFPVYFFIGQRKFYRESLVKSIVKCLAIYIINIAMLVVLIMGITIYALFHIA